MIRTLVAAIFVFSLFVPPSIFAQPQADSESENMQGHLITVIRGGESYAKPDLGIMVMTIQSSSPIAEEAVAENAQKAKAVEASLAAIGFSSAGYKITSVSFGHAGGPMFGPNQPALTVYQASQFIYIFFEAADLNDVAKLTEKTATVLEALRKAGAVPSNPGGPRFMGEENSLIIYTIKDSVEYERKALQQAIARARDAAQDVATGLGIQITGLRSVRASSLSGNLQRGNIAMEGLPYRFYSTKSDELRIHANATVEYEFK